MKKFLSQPKIILISLLSIAIVLRLLSFGWNVIPHGDVQEDALASASFLENGHFIIEEYSKESDQPFYYSIKDKGGRFLIQHPPLWPLLGAGLTYLLGLKPSLENNFFSFKILSLISGIILIILAYLLTKRLINQTAGLIIAGWLSISYLMIDYSANGAFYILQAALYLLWALVALKKNLKNKALYLGIITGFGYLINFQFIIAVPVSLLIILFQKEKPMLKKIKDALILSGSALAIASPWLIRNYLLFGNPFYYNYFVYYYFFEKSGVSRYIKDNVIYFNTNINTYLLISKNVLTNWLPHNIYYASRKLFILAPLAFVFFSFALVDYLFSFERLKKMIPLLLILAFHLFVTLPWPIIKFRYFVPILPLVFIIALEQIYNFKTKTAYKNILIGAIFVFIATLSFLTYRSVPTHTYYYDGAITTDPFGRKGEFDFMKEQGLIYEK